MIADLADHLAQWPNIVVVLGFSGVMLALLFVALKVGRRLFRKADHERSAWALDTFKLLGPLAGLFLSFSLVQSIGQFRTTDAHVSREATNIYQFHRAIAAAPAGPLATAADEALINYVRLVLSDEWSAMKEGRGESPAPSQALVQLQHAVDALVASLPPDSRLAADIDNDLDQIQDDRASRLGVAHGGLPGVMWLVLALMFALIFVCAAFLQGRARRHPLPTLYVAGLGLLAALLFIFDRPFQGDLSISPAPIAKVLGQINAHRR